MTLGCQNSRKVWQDSESVAFAQSWRILQTRVSQSGDHMKMSFDYSQIQKWMLQIARVEKVYEKSGVICQNS